MRQSFSNAADPVPAADDAAAVLAATRVAALAVPKADYTATVTSTTVIYTAVHVAATSVVPAAARTSRWPDIPEAISDVPLFLD